MIQAILYYVALDQGGKAANFNPGNLCLFTFVVAATHLYVARGFFASDNP